MTVEDAIDGGLRNADLLRQADLTKPGRSLDFLKHLGRSFIAHGSLVEYGMVLTILYDKAWSCQYDV